ncbi:MAG: hypothetical protein ABR597_14255 [Bacteroidales bacterium]
MAAGSFTRASFRMTGVVRRIEEKEEKGRRSRPFSSPPHSCQPCHPERSEGSRGHTTAENEPGRSSVASN